MKLSASNIGWCEEQDTRMYEILRGSEYTGLEIAPTRIFSESPYDKIKEAEKWSRHIYETYGFSISSMQSIWYGKKENIFGTQEERVALIDYSKKAIEFAAAIKCNNLVFGCPKNRTIPEGVGKEIAEEIAVCFFKELGDYAKKCGTTFSLEANPKIYNTNYINDTAEAIELIEKVNSEGFMLNLDVGTMIENKETIETISDKICLINHVHISEPMLVTIQERAIHKDLTDLLAKCQYQGFVSIEMGKKDSVGEIEKAIRYARRLVG